MSGGWSPVVHLWSHCGGKLLWDDAQALFRPDGDKAPTGADGRPFVSAAGSANGGMSLDACMVDALRSGRVAAERSGFKLKAGKSPVASELPTATIEPVWIMPQ